MIGQLIFILIAFSTAYFAFIKYKQIRENILLGSPYDATGNAAERWKNVILIAFGQKKMFKNAIPAILHLFIYTAFILTQVELIEIFVDGIFGSHRVFAHSLGGFYTFLISFIEILSILAFISTILFLYRRNILKVPRLVKSELNGWPKLDANLILLGEILLITGIFSMNGADTVLQSIGADHYVHTGKFAVSSWLGPLLFSGLDASTLTFIERFGWWLHIMVVFGFIAYLPFSKHLHIFLAFPNVYFAKLQPRGEMDNMPAIMNEVKSMMGLEVASSEDVIPSDELPQFGSKDITDLKWKNIMDAYSCTECGRCTAACPANITGKKLSPRKIMMDVRDRATEVGQLIKSGNSEYIRTVKKEKYTTLTKDNFDDNKSLFNYITKEEINACTTCNACVEACPVMIDPLDIILQLRRYEILTESSGPTDWTPMFNSLENQGSVWQIPQERDAWTRD